MNKFSKLLLVCVACASFFVRSRADAATYRFDLQNKHLDGGVLALGEEARLVLQGIGSANPSDLYVILADKSGAWLAGTGTNFVPRAGGGATGVISLATEELAAKFAGASALAEKTLVLAAWDASQLTLLGSAPVSVRNNPFCTNDLGRVEPFPSARWGDDPTVISAALAMATAAAARAEEAYAAATNASAVDASLRAEFIAATNDLWEAIAEAGSSSATNWAAATNDLWQAIDATSGALSAMSTNYLPAKWIPRSAPPSQPLPLDRGRHEVWTKVNFTNSLGLKGEYIDNWSDLTSPLEAGIATLDTALNGPGGATNRIQKLEAATNALNAATRTNEAAISDIKAYTNQLASATNALNTLSRTNASAIADIRAYTNRLASATNALDTLSRTNAADIADLRAYTNRLASATNALNTLSRTNAAAISDIKAYTNRLASATNALDTLSRTNEADIADLRDRLDGIDLENFNSETHFWTNVFLADNPGVPLHLRLPTSNSNNVVRTVNGRAGEITIEGTNGVSVSGTNGTVTVSAAEGTFVLDEDSTSARTAATLGSRDADTDVGPHSLSVGYNASVPGWYSIGAGYAPSASGNYSAALGTSPEASNDCSFVWQGLASTPPATYGSHGDGSFSINPQGGAEGVWIGETNLHQIVTNAIAELAVPMWPRWYRFGGGFGIPENTNTASGLWYEDNIGRPDYMNLSMRDDGWGGGSLNIYARGHSDSILGPTKLNLHSDGLLNLSAYRMTATATNPASGLTLTNSADGDFAVTWNGITKHGFDDSVESTGDVSAASFTLGEVTLEEWRGQLQGPNWLTPARFDWEATVSTTVTTNIGPETDGHWAVLTRAREVVTEKEFILAPDIKRNQWDAAMETAVDGPATLSAVGDGTYLLEWDDGSAVGDTATVAGQLGDWRDSITVERKEVGNVITQQWFSSFAPGGVRERLAEVMDTWTNMSGNIYRFSNFSVGKTSTVETLRLTPNPSFWARNTDLSGVSVWNDNGGYYYTRPATLVASNLAYGAAHWSPPVGTTVGWYGRDSALHSSKIVDQRRMTGDLCLSKISPPLDTDEVSAYPILDLGAIEPKIQAADSGVAVQALPPMPVLAMAQSQRGFIMRSELRSGGVFGIFDAAAGEYIRNSRNCAVGGDSGHPVFVSTDATNLVLVGCYWTPGGISVPGDSSNKELVLAAAAAMGADPSALRFEAWTNWPTYMGPLSMGGGGGGGGSDDEEEQEEEDDEGGE